MNADKLNVFITPKGLPTPLAIEFHQKKVHLYQLITFTVLYIITASVTDAGTLL